MKVNFSHISRWHLLIFAFSLFLAGCISEGVAGFSPGNRWVAVITNDAHLYTTDLNGNDPVLVDTQPVLGFGTSFNPSGDQILYALQSGVCLGNARATQTCSQPILPIPNGASLGEMTFLPGGQVLVVYGSPQNWTLDIYPPQGGEPVVSETGINAFFLNPGSFIAGSGPGGGEFFLTPYTSGNQRLAYTQGSQVFSLVLSPNLEGPTPLGSLSAAAADVINRSNQQDITARVLSPDGRHAAVRTQEGEGAGATYGLYTLDLANPDAQPITLVSGANFFLQFAFSPNGDYITYESNQDTLSIFIAGAGGENPSKLVNGASSPTWH